VCLIAKVMSQNQQFVKQSILHHISELYNYKICKRTSSVAACRTWQPIINVTVIERTSACSGTWHDYSNMHKYNTLKSISWYTQARTNQPARGGIINPGVTTSGNPGNTENLLEFETPSGNTGNLLEFNCSSWKLGLGLFKVIETVAVR